MINSVGSVNTSDQVYFTKEKSNNKGKENKNTIDESGVIIDIGNADTASPTYTKPATIKPNAEEIKKLWEQTDRATESLRKLVEGLIGRQGKKVKDVKEGKEVVTVDDQVRAEAEKMISEDGEWGVKAVSKRIVDFAKAISGGDKSKINDLKNAIEEGFKEAGKEFGGELPDISKKTHDEIMNQLDNWGKEA